MKVALLYFFPSGPKLKTYKTRKMISSLRSNRHTFFTLSHLKALSSSSYYQSLHTKPYEPNSPFNPNGQKSRQDSNFPNPPLTTTIITESIDYNETTVRETLSSCYGNDWKLAFEFFNWVESECGFEHTTETFNRMIDILGKFFEFDLSWDLIHRMQFRPFSYPNHATFRILFKRYVSAHLVNEAISAYHERLGEFNLRDDTSFVNLIDALCEHKHVIEAEELFMGNLEFNGGTKIYNMILRGWFKMGWWSKCREFWEEMDKRGVVKDLHSYSIYMDILCKSGKSWKAVQLYKEMKKRIKLDVVAYNTVIRAIGRSEGVDFAMGIFREMVDLGCAPTVVTFNTIIKLLCGSGRFREAYGLFDQMHRKGCVPDVITYHCIFGCLEKPREILALLDKMIGSGVRPRTDTYVMLMRKFGRWGFLRPVFIVWEKMEEHGCSPDEFAYTALIDTLVQKGMLDMARKYDQEMLAKGLSGKSRVDFGIKLLNRQSQSNGRVSEDR